MQIQPCPFHVLKEHLLQLRHRFGNNVGVMPSELPLFPDAQGKFVSKDAMVRHLEALVAQHCHGRINGGHGASLGGHSFRVTGAQFLAASGLPLIFIQLLGRWQSDAVARYVADAPLVHLSSTYKSLHQPLHLDEVLAGLRGEVSAVQLQVASLDEKCKALLSTEVDFVQLKEVAAKSPIPESIQFPHVRNLLSGKVHLRSCLDVDHGSSIIPAFWVSACGWPYGCKPFERCSLNTDNERELCKVCFRASLAADELSSES